MDAADAIEQKTKRTRNFKISGTPPSDGQVYHMELAARTRVSDVSTAGSEMPQL